MCKLNYSIQTVVLLMTGTFFAMSLGCSSIAERIIEKPKVTLERVGLENVNGSGATVLFGVGVDNPNPFSLKVDSLRYDVEIGGKAFGSGKIERPAEVAAHSKSVIDIPVPVKFADVFSSILDFINQKTSSYRVKGEARFGLLSIPFDEKGDLKLHE